MQDPAVLVNTGGGAKFKMWYGSLHGVGYATSNDGTNWVKKPDPVLTQTLDIEKGALNQPRCEPLPVSSFASPLKLSIVLFSRTACGI